VMVIVAPDPARREAAARRAIDGMRALPRELVERIETDEPDTRAFLRAHRELYVPVDQLEAARDALREQVARQNPLYVELDDPPSPHALDDLRARQRDALARLDRPALVSADGRTQAIVIRSAFVATDVDRDLRLQRRLDAIADAIRADDSGIAIGYAGGLPVTLAEHHALVHGVVLSTLITGALVALVLLVHLRSRRLLALIVANIAAATLVGFGIAALTVGQLNAATAFLGAIVAGNGVNYGILLAARFAEERAARGEPKQALARAIAGTLRPTLVASLGAAIAYGALGATAFRGFADFAAIGSVGMIVCWIASFTLLPALILRFAPSPPRPGRAFSLAARAFRIGRPAVVVAAAGIVLAGAGAVSWRYLAHDPYEYDMTRLHSRAADAIEVRAWQRIVDRELGRGVSGLAGPSYLAVDDPRELPAIVDQLRALAARDPMVGPSASILDVVPADQPRRLALLGELRELVDRAAPALDDTQRAELDELRPRDGLAPIGVADLPPGVIARLRERDGRIGLVASVRPGPRFDENDGRDLIAFAAAVRSVRTADGSPVTASGGSLLFADVLLQIRRDGPRVTALAALGLVAMVVLVVGRNRRAVAVLVASAAGSLAMIAACALAGLRIDFLDFVALPITLGLGIDYAINMADRAGASTAGSVLVCSLTTVIGYASLLVSDNLAIRGFGVASLIGELTCVTAALAIVPAILALGRHASMPRGVSEHARTASAIATAIEVRSASASAPAARLAAGYTIAIESISSTTRSRR
ncbi:MAG TPA: MMPL family transporter, partial [Kofleriaceae bacterium]|nr:MMPL family transporter [Kofleriaceae bacterium]